MAQTPERNPALTQPASLHFPFFRRSSAARFLPAVGVYAACSFLLLAHAALIAALCAAEICRPFGVLLAPVHAGGESGSPHRIEVPAH